METKITHELVKTLLEPRLKNAEKRDFGHVLLIGGSYGMIGAITMAASAALRSGAGLVSVLAPRCGYTILQSSVPEAMIIKSTDDNELEHLPDITAYQYIGAGPGLGRSRSAAAFIDTLLQLKKKCIFDADALNIIAENQWQQRIPEGSLLTPNIREFQRLFISDKKGDVELIQKKYAYDLNIYILLKGAESTIVYPNGKIFINTSGNPGMAKGGSGDVLTGIITGLWGRYNDLEKAMIAGVYLHGLAGDIAASEYHIEGMLPTDIISCLPKAFKSIYL